MQLSRSQRRRGFTLIEAAIVLGVFGIIVAALWTAGTAVRRNQMVGQAQKDYLTVVQNVRALYGAQGGFTSYGAGSGVDATAAMVTAGVFPAEMFNGGGTTPRDPWGAAIEVRVWDPNSFWLLVRDGATPQICSRMLAGVVGSSRDPGIDRVWRSDGSWGDASRPVGATTYSADTVAAVSDGESAALFCTTSVGYGFRYLLKI